MISDPIADMMIRIKNAGMVKKTTVSVPFSKIKVDILNVLKKEGYIENFVESGKGVKKTLEIVLKYYSDDTCAIKDFNRISKLSCRRYVKAKEIYTFNKGYGLRIISTPKGIMKDSQAKEMGLGGEILFSIK